MRVSSGRFCGDLLERHVDALAQREAVGPGARDGVLQDVAQLGRELHDPVVGDDDVLGEVPGARLPRRRERGRAGQDDPRAGWAQVLIVPASYVSGRRTSRSSCGCRVFHETSRDPGGRGTQSQGAALTPSGHGTTPSGRGSLSRGASRALTGRGSLSRGASRALTGRGSQSRGAMLTPSGHGSLSRGASLALTGRGANHGERRSP